MARKYLAGNWRQTMSNDREAPDLKEILFDACPCLALDGDSQCPTAGCYGKQYEEEHAEKDRRIAKLEAENKKMREAMATACVQSNQRRAMDLIYETYTALRAGP